MSHQIVIKIESFKRINQNYRKFISRLHFEHFGLKITAKRTHGSVQYLDLIIALRLLRGKSPSTEA